MLTHYPDIKPYQTHELDVGHDHVIYVEECGIPDGIPIVVIHGGPGVGCSPLDRCYFDPLIYRIVLFDQRGCGRSTPHAHIEHNTPQDLVNDMEKIREHLDIEKWFLFGGSWGSTLALLYAQTHSQRVLGMILRGIFLCRPHDLDWIYEHGARHIFPEQWEAFTDFLPEPKNTAILDAYHDLLTGSDEVARMNAAKHWAQWEANCATLEPNKNIIEFLTQPTVARAFATISNYYFINQCFMEPNQLLANCDKIKDIPGFIIHGRYDMLCPASQAWRLHLAWPQSELRIVRAAGHAASEPPITDALIHATVAMAQRFKEGL